MRDKRIPDTSEAEQWLDPFTFIVDGKVYRIEPDGTVTVVELPDKQEG